jgi:hypothetical protein
MHLKQGFKGRRYSLAIQFFDQGNEMPPDFVVESLPVDPG